MTDLVSIIMPSYNTAEYIAEAIESVLAQTYPCWELIVVDDCSTDSTDEIVIPYLKDSRIKYSKSRRNRGAAVARNYGLRKAKGRWVAFLDSDDLWQKNKLERQVAFMEKNGYAFSYTNYGEIDGQSRRTGKLVSGPKKITRKGMYHYCWPGCLTVMFDRKKVGRVQAAKLKKNNDYAMWLQVARVADCYLLDELLAWYRRGRAGSLSNHGPVKLIKWHYLLFRYGDHQNIAMAVWYTFQNLFFGCIKKLCYTSQF